MVNEDRVIDTVLELLISRRKAKIYKSNKSER